MPAQSATGSHLAARPVHLGVLGREAEIGAGRRRRPAVVHRRIDGGKKPARTSARLKPGEGTRMQIGLTGARNRLVAMTAPPLLRPPEATLPSLLGRMVARPRPILARWGRLCARWRRFSCWRCRWPLPPARPPPSSASASCSFTARPDRRPSSPAWPTCSTRPATASRRRRCAGRRGASTTSRWTMLCRHRRGGRAAPGRRLRGDRRRRPQPRRAGGARLCRHP